MIDRCPLIALLFSAVHGFFSPGRNCARRLAKTRDLTPRSGLFSILTIYLFRHLPSFFYALFFECPIISHSDRLSHDFRGQIHRTTDPRDLECTFIRLSDEFNLRCYFGIQCLR